VNFAAEGEKLRFVVRNWSMQHKVKVLHIERILSI